MKTNKKIMKFLTHQYTMINKMTRSKGPLMAMSTKSKSNINVQCRGIGQPISDRHFHYLSHWRCTSVVDLDLDLNFDSLLKNCHSKIGFIRRKNLKQFRIWAKSGLKWHGLMIRTMIASWEMRKCFNEWQGDTCMTAIYLYLLLLGP